MYCGYYHLSVCVCVCVIVQQWIPTLLHIFQCNFGEQLGYHLVVHREKGFHICASVSLLFRHTRIYTLMCSCPPQNVRQRVPVLTLCSSSLLLTYLLSYYILIASVI